MPYSGNMLFSAKVTTIGHCDENVILQKLMLLKRHTQISFKRANKDFYHIPYKAAMRLDERFMSMRKENSLNITIPPEANLEQK